MDCSNQYILITGGASGLGAACARHFAANQSKIIILDNNINEASNIANELNGTALECDVANPNSVDECFKYLEANSTLPRVCINCAGIAPAKRIVGKSGPMPYEEFTKTIDINLNGTFNILRQASYLISQLDPINEHGERGVIINTASIAGFEGQLGQAAYAASKAGIIGLTLPAARELSRFGIRVNTIAPGVFATSILHNMPQDIQDSLINSIPFPKRLGNPEEFANLAHHIVTNSMLNGSTIRLDGALRMA